jgi:HEAT repeat protein
VPKAPPKREQVAMAEPKGLPTLPPKPAPLPSISDFSDEIPPGLQPVVDGLGGEDPVVQVESALRLRALGRKAAPATPHLIKRLRSRTPVTLSRRDRKRLSDAEQVEGLSPGRAAAMALVAIGDVAVPFLLKALKHSDRFSRAGAAWALGEIKHSATVDPLIEALKDPQEVVREAAAEALGKIRDPRTIPLLVTLLNKDDSPDVRRATEVALRNLTDVPQLIKGLKDRSTVVQDNCAYILWLMTAKEYKKDVAAWETWYREQQKGKAQVD